MSLAGSRVLVTRAGEDAAELEELLRNRGAVPLRMPCIAFEDLPGAQRLPASLAGGFDLVVVSSPHAARLVRAALGPNRPPFAAVGAASAEGLPGEVLVPSRGAGADALIAELSGQLRGRRVLLPQAERATPALRQGLEREGAHVEVLPLYRTITPATADLSQVARADAIAFASGSAVRGFYTLAGAAACADKVVACIGASTAAEARARGIRVDAIGDEGLSGLCDALALALGRRQG